MKKTFVLDTNVLLHSHQAIFSFKDNHVVIPLGVIEELDCFKGHNDERGREARQLSRELDKLREKGNLSKGVKLPNGGTLTVAIDHTVEEMPIGLDMNKVDNRILACAFALKQKRKHQVYLVSKDINCRIKADALGVLAADFETNKIDVDELYKGWQEITLPHDVVKTFLEQEQLVYNQTPLFTNEFVVIKCENSNQQTVAR